MTAATEQNELKLVVAGAETADNTVPAEVLVRVLQGLQQTAVLLEAASDQPTIERRFRPTEDLRRRTRLRCGPLLAGSVGVSVLFPETQPHLFGQGQRERMIGFMGAVSRGDQQRLKEILPDSRFRDRALRETLGFLPRSGQRWGLEISNGHGPPVRLTGQTRRTVEEWFRDPSQTSTVLTGQLVSINFDKNEVDVRYPPTNRTLRCSYEIDSEDLMLQSRRDWVQVQGVFELDNKGNPRSVVETTKIEPLDLSPLAFDLVAYNGRELGIKPPLVLLPVLDEESKQLLVVEDAELTLHAYATTREGLEDEIKQQLFLLWDEYAQEDPANLSPRAHDLQILLKNRMQEGDHAQGS